MKIRNKIIWSSGIIIVSFIMICIWGNFSAEAFLIDDNRTQWFPVIERAYDDLFKNGHIAIYDFFQLKGLAIAEPGYYSIMNPMMMVAYMLSHFTFLPFSTLTIYIAILFSLGNTFFWGLCKELGYKEAESVLFTLGYSVISSFFSFNYWYYVFDNHMFIPLLLYVFFKTRGTKLEYISCGSVLGLEILFGNVQYTCYHYMIYGIICATYIIFKNRKMIVVFFLNVMIGLLLSTPFMLLMLRSSKNFGTSEFRDMDIPFLDFLFGAVMPVGILKEIGASEPLLFKDVMTRFTHTWLYNGFFMVFLVALLASFIKSFCKKKNKKFNIKNMYEKFCADQQKQFTAGALLCLLFFVSFACNGIVALLLSKMPVIKNFRYLFKCLFLIEPMLSVMTVSLARSFSKKTTRIAAAVSSIFIIVGLVNNYYVVKDVKAIFTDEKTLSQEAERSEARDFIEKLDWDTSLYRNAVYMRQSQIIPECFHYWNGFFRNYATAMDIYSLSAYEISADSEHIKSFDKIYDPANYNTRFFNAGIVSYVLEEAQYEPEELARQLRQNSVKYIFVQQRYEVTKSFATKQDCTSELLEALDLPEGVHVEKVCPINDYYNVIVLDGVNALCTDGTDSVPIFSESMDMLSFETTGAAEYTLSFSFNKRFKAELRSGDGITILETAMNEYGNTVIRIPDGRNGTVILAYKDSLCTAGFVFEILITSMFVCVMILIVIKDRRVNKADEDAKEDIY